MATIAHLHPRSAATLASALASFLAELRDRRGLADNTVASYRYDLRTAAQALVAPLDQITAAQVEAFLASRDERPSTTNRRITSLNRCFAWAHAHGLVAHNPVAHLEPKQDDVRLPRPIPDADLPALDTAIAKAPAPYTLIFTLLRETGLRADAVLGLNVGDVVLEPSREGLHLHGTKHNADRVAVRNADVMKRSLRLLRAALRTLGLVDASLPLFRSNRGTRVPYDTLSYQWQRLCVAAGLRDADGKPRSTIHPLRHTAGTAFLRDEPEHIVSRMLGHRDPRSTRRSAGVTEDQVRAALAAHRRRSSRWRATLERGCLRTYGGGQLLPGRAEVAIHLLSHGHALLDQHRSWNGVIPGQHRCDRRRRSVICRDGQRHGRDSGIATGPNYRNST